MFRWIFFLIFSSVSSLRTGPQDIYLMGLFPFEGQWQGGPASVTAAVMALEDINARSDILQGYRLNLVYGDTKCNAGVGLNAMYKMLYEKPVKLLIIGAGCSSVSEATAQASNLWNLTQISYASVSPALSDKRKFPRFVRVSSADQKRNPAIIKILKYFNWTKVSTIDQSNEIFTADRQDFVHLLSKGSENISVQRAETFSIDPRKQVKNLKKYDSRIILAGFYEAEGREIFCEAYKQGLYGPKHVWFIPGWLEDNWATSIDPKITCTPSQMAAVHEGNIVTKFVRSNPVEERGIAMVTANQFMNEFKRRLRNTFNRKPFALNVAHQAYDSVWVAALALNKTIQTLMDKGISRRLEDFTYNDTEMADIILQNVKETSFLGVKGYIKFNQHGDPVGPVVVAQVQDGVDKTVGTWQDGRNDDKISWLKNPPMKWPGGHVPLDAMKTDELVSPYEF